MNPILYPNRFRLNKNFSRDFGSVVIKFYVMGFTMEFIMKLIMGFIMEITMGFIMGLKMGLRNHFNPLCTDWVEKAGAVACFWP